MSFERFEVRAEDASGAPAATVWGPSHSLARAREVAQRTAIATGAGVRIDSVVYDHVGDMYPETDPLEFYGPDPAAAGPRALICDVCGKPADELTQHCHMSPFIGRAHMLCGQCLKEFPVPK